MKTSNVLVLRTQNSTRSILGGALVDHLGHGLIHAFSAGSQPSGEVDPLALQFDFLFTVCAGAAGAACPVWPGHPATAHWGIGDLAQMEPPGARRAAFAAAYNQIARRIAAFLKLPRETMSTAAIAAAAREIHDQVG